MNLRDLEYLVAVADHGSFRQAAIACEVSQPTLSTQVKKLETELGVDLVERGATPLRLTPAGADIAERARRIVAEVGQIRQAALWHTHPSRAALRLGVFPTLGAYLLPRVIGQVKRQFPDLTLLVTEEKTSDILALVRSGGLDAALVALPLDGDDLVARPLFSEHFHLAVPSDHPLGACKDPVSPDAVRGEDVLVLGPGHCLGDQVTEWLEKVGGHPRDDHRASSLESLRAMIAAGSGITLLPDMAVRDVTPGVVVRPFRGPAPQRTIALVWRPASALAPLLDAVAPALVPPLGAHVLAA